MTEIVQRPSLRVYGENGILPLRSPCPAGCKFCYETHLPKLVKNVKLVRTPAYTSETFQFFHDGLVTSDAPATPVSPVYVEDGTVHYSSMSDIFCQGLNRDQIELLIQHNVGKERRELATTGNHLDPETAEYFSTKYPDDFRLHYSVITFLPEHRKKLFTDAAARETVLKIVSVLREPKVYLCNLEPEQVIDDIRTLNEYGQPGIRLHIARMHCTSMHPPEIRAIARRSGFGYGIVADWLSKNRGRLTNIDEINFQAPPEGYTWTFRHTLAESVRPLALGKDDVVLSSSSAANILRQHVIPAATEVIPVFDSLGATTSFTTTISTENILGVLAEVHQRRSIARLVLPSSIYWMQNRYSVDGRSVDDIKEIYPNLEIAIVDISTDIRRARLTVDECMDYYQHNPGAESQGDQRQY